MFKNTFTIIPFLLISGILQAQSTVTFADSIRKIYNIPELGFAVVSSGKVHEMKTIGLKRINAPYLAEPDDKFRIGSNTKSVTGFITALLVKQNKISWNTKFFDLFPELKAASNDAYHHLTLLNLLTFRTKLIPYTYTYPEPTQEQIHGNEAEQRYQFASWFFKQDPIQEKDTVNFSNLGYVAAGLMLERASGKTYKQLVMDLGKQIDVTFGFGAPNSMDSLQPWGHDKELKPEPPGENYKLNWLLAAGNIHASLPDYAKFIQLQLRGLSGQSELLTKEEFNFLHFGLAEFAVGWFWETDANKHTYAAHIGNPGTFLTKVYVFKDIDKAIMLFSNAQTADADQGLDILFKALYRKYIN